jgi:hypothetical protein
MVIWFLINGPTVPLRLVILFLTKSFLSGTLKIGGSIKELSTDAIYQVTEI